MNIFWGWLLSTSTHRVSQDGTANGDDDVRWSITAENFPIYFNITTGPFYWPVCVVMLCGTVQNECDRHLVWHWTWPYRVWAQYISPTLMTAEDLLQSSWKAKYWGPFMNHGQWWTDSKRYVQYICCINIFWKYFQFTLDIYYISVNFPNPSLL